MKKIISNIIALVVCAALVVAIGFGSSGFRDWNVKNWFNSWGKGDAVEQPQGDPLEGDPDAQWDEHFIVEADEGEALPLERSRLARASYAANGIEEDARCVMLLTVTPSPEDADLRCVTYSARFNDPSSEWAQGKNVSDYVQVKPYTVNVPEELALQATVALYEEFGEQIVIDVTATDLKDNTVSTSVTCDYVKRIESLTVKMRVRYEETPFNGVLNIDSSGEAWEIIPEVVFGVGSVMPTVAISGGVELAEDFVKTGMANSAFDIYHIQTQDYHIATNAIMFYANGQSLRTYSFRDWYKDFFEVDGTKGSKLSEEEFESIRRVFVRTCATWTSSCYQVFGAVTATYGTYSETKTAYLPSNTDNYSALHFDYAGLVKEVDGITVDQNAIF